MSGSSAAGTVPASTGRVDRPARRRLPGVAGDQLVFDGVADQVRRRRARVHAEAREAVGVVVQVQEAGALVVGEVERRRARARVVGGPGRALVDRRAPGVEPHVRDVGETGAGLVGRALAGRRHPLVLRTAADPGRDPALQVQRRPVLRIRLVAAERAGAGAGDRRVHRQEELAALAGRQLVDELDAHGTAAARLDQRPEVVDGRRLHRVAPVRVGPAVQLHVAAQPGARQVAVQLLRELAHGDLVVVRAGVADRVRHGDRDVLAEVVGRRRPDAGQRVDELAEERTEGPVGAPAEVVGGGERVELRRCGSRLAGRLLRVPGRRIEPVRLRGPAGHHRHEVAARVGDGPVGDAGVGARGAARRDAGLRRHVVAGAAAGPEGQRGRSHRHQRGQGRASPEEPASQTVLLAHAECPSRAARRMDAERVWCADELP